jgi:UDP-sugar transporter A1/2/3
VLQNNLLFKGIKLLSPTAYVVCSQSKILTSAFWSVVLLKTKITLKQYIALIILVFGMFIVQTDEVKRRETSSEEAEANNSVIEGSIIVLAAAVTSGFAGTYLEKMYKEGLVIRRTVWYRNTQLACLSLPVAVLVAHRQDSWLINANGWFQGYDLVVWGIITLQALGGLIVAAVLRYAGNVLKCFAVSVSICACALATSLSHTDTSYLGLHANVVIGVTLVIGSTFLYCDVL